MEGLNVETATQMLCTLKQSSKQSILSWRSEGLQKEANIVKVISWPAA